MNPPEHAPLDRWTPMHALLGAACRLIGLDLAQTLALAIGWEAAEALHFEPVYGFGIESLSNRAADVGANAAGWALANKVAA